MPTCHSTNDICGEMIQNEKVSDGFCLYTSHQTKGRGQRGNIWEANAGENITMSLILFPDFLAASKQFDLNIAVSLAIHKSLSNYLNEKLTIKWPNDLYFEYQKIGGILIENTILGSNLNSTIIGIGINVNQETFENAHASSLKNIINGNLDIAKIIDNILENIEYYYLRLKKEGNINLRIEYLQHLFRFAILSKFKKNEIVFDGKISGIDEFGRLEIDTEFGKEIFSFKEVEFVI